jgi:hypothetical protein
MILKERRMLRVNIVGMIVAGQGDVARHVERVCQTRAVSVRGCGKRCPAPKHKFLENALMCAFLFSLVEQTTAVDIAIGTCRKEGSRGQELQRVTAQDELDEERASGASAQRAVRRGGEQRMQVFADQLS